MVHPRFCRLICVLTVQAMLILPLTLSAQTAENDPADQAVDRLMDMFGTNYTRKVEAIEWLRQRGDPDVVPAFIQYKRFFGAGQAKIDAALAHLTGENVIRSWHQWMLWQETHPEIVAVDGFDRIKAHAMRLLDPAFGLFLYPGVAHDIRLEEIVWGGVLKDGIPALTNPSLIDAKAAGYLKPDDLVFGVEINGDARAYPLRIMNWHEMFNDVIGGVPVSLAYCTLCGSGILFDTRVPGRKAPLVFGSSGFLFRSNKLMYDTETHSLWNQFTGKPVVGKLTGSGIELKPLPVAITSWSDWKNTHPDTGVLSLETGHRRDYGSGVAYKAYFDSPDLMFPAILRRKELKPKDFVFALRGTGADKAWPLTLFEGGKVVNDTAGVLDVVLIGNAATRSVRAYQTDGQKFTTGAAATEVVADGQIWTITESALEGGSGKSLKRLPGHIAYWFAWAGYLGASGELAKP